MRTSILLKLPTRGVKKTVATSVAHASAEQITHWAEATGRICARTVAVRELAFAGVAGVARGLRGGGRARDGAILSENIAYEREERRKKCRGEHGGYRRGGRESREKCDRGCRLRGKERKESWSVEGYIKRGDGEERSRPRNRDAFTKR